MSKIIVSITDFDQKDFYDKNLNLEVGDKLFAKVDYDDVNHQEVEAAVLHLQELIKEHWSEERFKELYKDRLVKYWSIDDGKYIRDDYDSLEDYLKSYLG